MSWISKHIHIKLLTVIPHPCNNTGRKSHSYGVWTNQDKLEQLERLRSEDTPRRLMITHNIESCWIPKSKQGRMTLKI